MVNQRLESTKMAKIVKRDVTNFRHVEKNRITTVYNVTTLTLLKSLSLIVFKRNRSFKGRILGISFI